MTPGAQPSDPSAEPTLSAEELREIRGAIDEAWFDRNLVLIAVGVKPVRAMLLLRKAFDLIESQASLLRASREENRAIREDRSAIVSRLAAFERGKEGGFQEQLRAAEAELSKMRANHPEDSCYGAYPKLRAELRASREENERLRTESAIAKTAGAMALLEEADRLGNEYQLFEEEAHQQAKRAEAAEAELSALRLPAQEALTLLEMFASESDREDGITVEEVITMLRAALPSEEQA